MTKVDNHIYFLKKDLTLNIPSEHIFFAQFLNFTKAKIEPMSRKTCSEQKLMLKLKLSKDYESKLLSHFYVFFNSSQC